MSELFFKIGFIVLWVAYILIRAPFDTKYKTLKKEKVLHQGTERILLVLLGCGLLLLPLVWALSPFLDNFNLGFPIWVRWAGIGLALYSLVYFWQVHRALGINWSPTLEIHQGHSLITGGPYKRIRHPMYLQIWLWALAQCLICSNIPAGFSGIIIWAIVYFVRVPREEKMMIETFGDNYIGYMKKTGRVIPKLR